MRALGKQHVVLFTVLVILAIFFSGCTNNHSQSKALSNGYYTAEAENYDDSGWKDFVSIYVNNGHIVTVEYDAKNKSGFIKSWDQDYMRNMNAAAGTYPGKYAKEYAADLLLNQDPKRIDAISGATHSYNKFIVLAGAVIEQARKGNKQIARVALPLAKE